MEKPSVFSCIWYISDYVTSTYSANMADLVLHKARLIHFRTAHRTSKHRFRPTSVTTYFLFSHLMLFDFCYGVFMRELH